MQHPSQSPPQAPKFIVLGIGNSLLSDDGVGIHVIRELQHLQDCSPQSDENTEFLDGGTLGYLLIDRVADADGLVIIDSANLGETPGAVRVFDGAGIEKYLDDNASTSVHEVGLIDLLQMMALNGSQPQRRALVGIQPATIDWGTEMSPAVAASVPLASKAVQSLLVNWTQQDVPCQS